jgi:hypothetical protein
VVTVIVDGENVRRSVWPNLSETRLLELVRAWAEREGVQPLIVFDGRAPVDAGDIVSTHAETADDWIAREASSYAPYWLVTSDRELRERVGGAADRVVGGGSFAREIQR